MERCSIASPPLSPTDDHRPLTPTVVAEVTCGERRRSLWRLRLRCWVFGQCGQPCCLLGGQPPLLAVYRAWAVNPDCHHWEVVESSKRKAGPGQEYKADYQWALAARLIVVRRR